MPAVRLEALFNATLTVRRWQQYSPNGEHNTRRRPGQQCRPGMRYVSEQFAEQPTRFWETDPAVWQIIIATNVNGPFFMARAAV